ncbi:MAG: tRNA lysidine(34) synthetase TilS [Actinomycetota bacterium]
MAARRHRPPGALPPGRSRDQLLAEVRAGLDGLTEGTRLVVAVSGGTDSTALASLVDEARPDLAVTLVHVRHGLRDAAIDERDAACVAELSRLLGRELVVRDVTVVRTGQGLEGDARDARLAALREVAAGIGAGAIALGHHADDQAETVVLRLARGSGLDGLSAMAPVAGDLVRPLLAVRHADLVRHVEGEGLPHVHDPMNEDDRVRRVRARTEVLPALSRLAPDVVGALTRLADLVRDDAELLDASARVAVGRDVPVHRVGRVLLVPSAALSSTHPALARRVVRMALVELTGRRPSAASVARVLAAGSPGAPSAMTLPGPVELTVEDGLHVFEPVAAERPDAPGGRASWVATPVPLPRVGTAAWAPAGLVVTVARSSVGVQYPLTLEGPGTLPPAFVRERLAVRLDRIDGLVVRHRHEGDRIRLPGGTRVLGDVLAEAGVPRAVRSRWPVVAHADDARVVWVPGIAVDEDRRRAGDSEPAHVLSVAPRGRAPAG